MKSSDVVTLPVKDIDVGLSKSASEPVQLVRFSEQAAGADNGGCRGDAPVEIVVPDWRLAMAARSGYVAIGGGAYRKKTVEEMARDVALYDYTKAWCAAKNNGLPLRCRS